MLRLSMGRRAACVILAAFLCAGLCACDYTNIEDLIVVAGLGVDPGNDGGYHITAEIAKPAADIKSGTTESVVYDFEGRTLAEAVGGLVNFVGGRIYLRHASIMIISEEIAKTESIAPLLKVCMHTSDLHATTMVAVSKNCSAQDILHQKSQQEVLISRNLSRAIDQQHSYWGKSVQAKLCPLYNEAIGGGCMLLPAITVIEDKESSKADLDGIAVLQESFLRGYLSPDEAQFCTIATENGKGGSLVHESEDLGRITLRYSDIQSDASPVLENGQLRMNLDVHLTGYVIDVNGTALTIPSADRDTLMTEMQDDISEKILTVVKKIQTQFGTDVFGMGARVQTTQRELWKSVGEDNWQSFFTEIPVSVHVVLDLKNNSIASN